MALKHAVLAACLLATASCARIGVQDLFAEAQQALALAGSDFEAALHSSAHEASEKKQPPVVISRFIAPPDEIITLVKIFKDVQEKVEKESGNVKYELWKSAADNFSFVAIAAWKTPEDLLEHLKADYVKEFLVEVAKAKVVVQTAPVLRVA